MSRLPPVPPASLPTKGPDGVPKTSVDVSHRVRHRTQQARRKSQGADISHADFSFWTMGIAGAAAAGIVWLLVKQRRPSPRLS
jgi:hypothetical protein